MNAWRLTIPVAPMRRADPAPRRSAKDPQARLREIAGVEPVKESVGARNDPEYARWKRQVGQFIKAHRPRPIFDEAVILCATFHVRPHDNIPDALLGLPHAVTPDLDRYTHAIKDALTVGEVWTDDKLSACELCLKVWSRERKRPHIDVLVVPYDAGIVARVQAVIDAGIVDVAEAS